MRLRKGKTDVCKSARLTCGLKALCLDHRDRVRKPLYRASLSISLTYCPRGWTKEPVEMPLEGRAPVAFQENLAPVSCFVQNSPP
jgi:hypothetical protein